MIIDIQKITKNSKLPERSNPSDGGADVFYGGDEPVTIAENNTAILDTGLKIAVPHGYVCEVKNRGSVAFKSQLLVGACLVDSGYEGTVKINLHNVGTNHKTIHPGEKIAQIIFYSVELPQFVEIESSAQLYFRTETNSNRKDGSFGSTGK